MHDVNRSTRRDAGLTFPWTWPAQMLVARMDQVARNVLAYTTHRSKLARALDEVSPLDCPFLLLGKRWTCLLCGFRTKASQIELFRDRPRKNCAARMRNPSQECIYLLDPTDEVYETKGCAGCPLILTLWKCGKFTEVKCLPDSRLRQTPPGGIIECMNCKSYIAR